MSSNEQTTNYEGALSKWEEEKVRMKNWYKKETLRKQKATLMDAIEKDLKESDYSKLKLLARSLIVGAIKREPAALAFLGPRIAPIIQQQREQPMIVQG